MNSALSNERAEGMIEEIGLGRVRPRSVERAVPISVRVAHLLREVAELIETPDDDGSRERAYGEAAMTLDSLARALRSPGARDDGRGRGRRETIDAAPSGNAVPPETLVLEIDATYRLAAARKALERVPPEAPADSELECVPVLYCHRDGWDFTALYSRTWRAIEAGRTSDWVIVHFHREGVPEGRCTVVSDAVRKRRVVLGLGG